MGSLPTLAGVAIPGVILQFLERASIAYAATRDADPLAQRVGRREERVRDQGAEHDDLFRLQLFLHGEEAPALDRQIANDGQLGSRSHQRGAVEAARAGRDLDAARGRRAVERAPIGPALEEAEIGTIDVGVALQLLLQLAAADLFCIHVDRLLYSVRVGPHPHALPSLTLRILCRNICAQSCVAWGPRLRSLEITASFGAARRSVAKAATPRAAVADAPDLVSKHLSSVVRRVGPSPPLARDQSVGGPPARAAIAPRLR